MTKTQTQPTMPYMIDNVGQRRSKSFSVSAIMKNSKLSTLIGEAWDAPLGSTKRKRAVSLLRTLRSVKTRTDGMGGGGYGYYRIYDGQGGSGLLNSIIPGSVGSTQQPSFNPNQISSPLQSTLPMQSSAANEPAFKNFKIVPSEPTPVAMQAPQANAPIPVKTPPVSGGWKVLDESIAKGFGGLMKMYDWIGSLGGTIGTESQKPELQNFELRADGVSVLNKKTGQVEPRFEVMTDGSVVDKYKDLAASAPKQTLLPVQTPAAKATVPLFTALNAAKQAAYPQTQSQEQLQPQVQGEERIDETQTPAAVESWYDDWYYNKLSPDERTQFNDLYQSVKTGIGPSTFAYLMMTDKEKLKKMFPNTPEAELPVGSSLARQVEGLDKQLRQELNLNQLETDMLRVKNRGKTLIPTLQNYIAGRDVYLNEIDQMIRDTKAKALKMDTGNPFIANSMSQYLDYLNILKGRQDKRYVDFLNTAITEHNNELTTLQDQYESAGSRYDREMQFKTAITTEDYNRWNDTLKEMYTNLDQQEERQLSKYVLSEQATQAHIKTLTDTVNAAGTTNPNYYKNKDTYMEIVGGLDWDNKDKVSVVDGRKGIADMMAIAQQDPKETTSDGVLFWLQDYAMPHDVETLMNAGELGKVKNIYGNMIKDYAQSGFRPTASAEAKNLGLDLAGLMENSFYNYLTGTEQAIAPLKDVLKDLTSTNTWSKTPKYTVDEKAEFLNNNEGVLNSSILSELFDNYVRNVSQGTVNVRDLYNFEQSDDKLASDVARDLSEYWKYSYSVSLKN